MATTKKQTRPISPRAAAVIESWGAAVRSVEEVAKELKVSEARLRNWMSAAKRAGAQVESLGKCMFKVTPPRPARATRRRARA